MATTSRLRIDTSIPSTSSHNPSKPLTLRPSNRLRSVSNASTSSELSVITPSTSSTNASTSSLPLRDDPEPRASSSRQPIIHRDSPSPPPSDYVLAMHDYSPSQSNATCLEFCAGQIIHVLNRDPSGWWDGEIDGRRGWFPSNYVNDVSLGEAEGQEVQESADETVVRHQVPRPSHRATQSVASAVSWATAPVNAVHALQPSSSRIDDKDYCHPLMTPLLHGISLLQSAVRSNRITHFQPSTACIVSCIRSLLSATECLTRDSEPIQQFPTLGHERKRILHALGLLVPQAKRASDFTGDEKAHAMEIDSMLRLSAQLFTAVRQFIEVAIQCGLELPERRATAAILEDSPTTPLTSGSDHISRHWDVTNALVRTPRRPESSTVGRTPGSGLRSRSMVNLRTPKPPSIRGQLSMSKRMPTAAMRYASGSGHRPAMDSVSSTASSASASSSTASTSVEQDHTPPSPPPFPRGPTAAAKVLEALRITHDHYLSTIAAFIGHAHSHSRTSHASSTGHMYDLVREIVEMVCRLLTIVDAVMRHPGVPALKLDKLRAAKEGLYSVTSSLAESVRLLTAPLAETSEDDEKQVLLRSATGALKAGADCVFSVKTCLNRSPGERPFILMMAEAGPQSLGEAQPPESGDNGAAPSLRRSLSMTGTLSPRMEEDVTIRLESSAPSSAVREQSPDSDQSGSSKHSLDEVPITPDEGVHPEPFCAAAPEIDLLSLASPSEDGTAWEASSQTQATQRILQEKMVNGQLPSIPFEPEFLQDAEAWMLSHDYSMDDVAYNNDGHLVGATIPVLVEKMTPHDVVVDPAFQAIFFLTFRLFSTPVDLVDAIINRYTIDAPHSLSPDDRALWQKRKGVPVRLRVTNLVRVWLEQHWQHPTDQVVIDSLMHFARQGISGMFPGPAQRIADLLEIRRTTGESAKNERRGDPGMSINPPGAPPPSEIPRPSMTKSLLSLLRSRSYGAIQITDFDALELARQLTIREAELYCAIAPEEVLLTGQDGAHTPNVKAMSKLSTTITGWVAESILNEHDTKKRTVLVKFFIKVADRCSSLKNYSTSRSILAALDSSTISRLHQTWNGLPTKSRNQLEALRKLADHSRNYHQYRTVLRNTAPPAVPFLGLYLTDVTFCREGNPSTRVSPLNPEKKLINFNKYHKLARIVQDMQRFQVPYHLRKIAEVEKYLDDAFAKAAGHGDLQDLYRRSLLVEPKQAADAPPSSDVGKLFNRL